MKRILVCLVLLGFLMPISLPASASVKAGSACPRLKATSTVNGYKYTCIKNGKKLVWSKGVKVVATKPTPSPSKPTAIGDPVGAIGSSSTPTPSPTVTPTSTGTVTPTPSKTKPAPVKYKNCTEARAAGVTPIRKETDPELYALNTALDGDKDGDACEN